MRKITLSIASCFILYVGFCQPVVDKDSSKIISSLYKTTNQVELKAKPTLNIYPNPAKNKITLQVKGFEPGMAVVKLVDIKGKLVREDSRLLTNGDEDVIMFLSMPAGIYFILLMEKNRVVKKKLIIQ